MKNLNMDWLLGNIRELTLILIFDNAIAIMPILRIYNEVFRVKM